MPHKNLQRPGWKGATVVCIAGGPSLCDAQLHQVADAHAGGRVRVIGVNNAYLRAPWCNALFACDLLWWKKHIATIRAQQLPCELWTQDNAAAAQFQLQRVRGAARPGLGTYELHTGGNGGYCAVNLAYLWGASRALLIGYDMQPGPKGEKHWHADHPAPMVQQQLFGEWIKRFEQLAKDCKRHGFDVVNCTPGSALPWFPRAHIEEALDVQAA